MTSGLHDFFADFKMDSPSGKATLLELADGEEVWVPKSLLQDNEDGSWTVPLWWAEQEGLV